MEQFVKNTQALNLLAVHRQEDNSEESETCATVTFIINMTNRVLDPQHVRDTLERVRCNAHPLYLDGVTCVGTAREQDPVEDDEQDEARVLEQLVQLVNANQSDVKQRVASLKKQHENVFKRSVEAQFALFTAEMQLARAQRDWVNVIEAAEMLLEIWTRCGLPDCYHTTETLHLQICLAAKQAGMLEKYERSAQKVSTIRQICGYSHPENLVS
ncbi:hypothetical protein PInf_016977 [Phytophthora infestans]|nr:hypothetical protein PInf_016977 [Phytophthora infestans]